VVGEGLPLVRGARGLAKETEELIGGRWVWRAEGAGQRARGLVRESRQMVRERRGLVRGPTGLVEGAIRPVREGRELVTQGGDVWRG
jgi:hypothetical protein